MRTVIALLFVLTASFQACDGVIGRPLSPGNGQGYEGVKPDGSSSPGGIYADNQIQVRHYAYAGQCADGGYQSLIRQTGENFELLLQNCQLLTPSAQLSGSVLSRLLGPPEALFYEGAVHIEVRL